MHKLQTNYWQIKHSIIQATAEEASAAERAVALTCCFFLKKKICCYFLVQPTLHSSSNSLLVRAIKNCFLGDGRGFTFVSMLLILLKCEQ